MIFYLFINCQKTFIFHENTLEQCVTSYSYCKMCKSSFYPNIYRHNATRKYYIQRQQFMNSTEFHFGGECVYSYTIFLCFSSTLLTIHASFHGFTRDSNSEVINKTAFPRKD